MELPASVPMIVPPMRWMVGMGPRPDQTSLASVALAILRPSSKLAFHNATASWFRQTGAMRPARPTQTPRMRPAGLEVGGTVFSGCAAQSGALDHEKRPAVKAGPRTPSPD